jgi:hypothetical protein
MGVTMHDERGFELIEFIFTMILVFTLALIIWQLMAYAHQQMVMYSAARDVARQAASYKVWRLTKAMKNACEGYDCSLGVSIGPSLCVPFVCTGKGHCVSATVKSPLVTVPIPGIPLGNIEVKASANAFCEEPDFDF